MAKTGNRIQQTGRARTKSQFIPLTQEMDDRAGDSATSFAPSTRRHWRRLIVNTIRAATGTQLGASPTGSSWSRRHARILCVLVAHVPALLVFGIARGFGVVHVTFELLPIVMCVVVAARRSLTPRERSVAASLGLMTSAAVLVHLADGRTEAHFLYFVLLGVLALYDDWVPYAAAVLFVLLEHGAMGIIAPSAVWGTDSFRGSPWLGAAVHGGFVLAASVVALVSWRWREIERSTADDRLRVTEEQFRLMFEAAPIGMSLVGADGHFLRVNAALCDIAGYSADELLHSNFQAITHVDDLDKDLDQVQRCLAGSLDGFSVVKRYVHRTGDIVWVEVNVAAVRDADGKLIHFVGQVIDITERRSVAATLAASEARFAALVEHGSDLISIADSEGRLIYASPAYRTVLGFDPAERIGQPMQDRIHPDDRAKVVTVVVALAATPGASATAQFRYAHADGSWRWLEATITNRLDDSAVTGFVINTRDVTEWVSATERLAHQATHDALTGLPNRTMLEDRIVQVRASARRRDEVLAAFFVDVDHFKAVNDTYGHAVGDLFLIEAARRLRQAARIDDTVARLGGDEFVVIASIVDEGAAHALAARLCDAFAEPFLLDGLLLAVAASVGIATTTDLSGDLDLLSAADIALYEAKATGGGGWAAYKPDSRTHDKRRSDRSRARTRDLVERPVGAPTSDPDHVLDDVFARYQTHIAEATQAVVVHVDGIIVAASRPAADLVGAQTQEQLLGRHVFEFVTPDSARKARGRQIAIQAGGWPHPEVVNVNTISGQVLSLEVTSTPAFWSGALASQMTLRLAQDRWAEIIRFGTELTRSMSQAAIITDLDYKVVAWNEEATQLYGWTHDEVIGKAVYDILSLAGHETERATARHDLQTNGRWEGLVTQVRRDGSLVTVAAVTQVIHDHEGNPIGVVSVNDPLLQPVTTEVANPILLDELETAIAHGQLLIAYQPIFDAIGNVAKVEALVRWMHPLRGLLMPDMFIPAAEDNPVMGSLTGEVLRQSCAQVAAWRDHGMSTLELTVNVSGSELADPTLVERVKAAIDCSGLPANALWLEITETALAKDAAAAGDGIALLCAFGVRIALDDFGTGFATLAQLHQFPSHALKIDRLFVEGITTADSGDAAIVRSVLALGHELGLDVIAEGVETKGQCDALMQMGCEFFQGYFFARPTFAEPPPSWVHTTPLVIT
jgi:diguanylate cyclase (GGDEF)-like protein/PAS domain S-box-containing protein